MNSISYLDSVLTRSLTSTSTSSSSTSTSARRASGTSTPSHSAPADETVFASQGRQALGRRASDYSLSSRRQRERQRLALSLGFSSLDGSAEHAGSGGTRKKRSSKRSSRAGSARGSDIDGPTAAESDARDAVAAAAAIEAGQLRAGDDGDNNNEGGRRRRERHPKSSSESVVASSTDERRRLKRTKSTPAQLRDANRGDGGSSSSSSSSSSRWGSLWGLGGWLDGSESYDSYARRSSSSSAAAAGTAPLSVRAGRRGGSVGETDTQAARTRRRASSGEANIDGIAPQLLLSEREREDVVDFEGFDPDDDGQSPIAPPSTPHPSVLDQSQQQQQQQQQLTPTATPSPGGTRGGLSSIGTGSRLSSLLFGALNPLTDDYFGPQPSNSAAASHARRSSAEEREQRRQRKASSNKVASKSQQEKQQQEKQQQEKQPQEKQQMAPAATATLVVVEQKPATEEDDDDAAAKHKEAGATSSDDGGAPSDPPPPYSDVASSLSASSSSSSSSLLLSVPQLPTSSSGVDSLPSSRKSAPRRMASGLGRGLRRVLEVLRRIVLAILLAPVRVVYLGRTARRRKQQQQQTAAVAVAVTAEPPHRRSTDEAAGAAAAAASPSRPTIGRTGSLIKFQTQSQADRPSAARHVAGRRSHRPPTPSADRSVFDDQQLAGATLSVADDEKQAQQESELSETDEDQVVTEEQAEARALRKAQRAQRLGQQQAQRADEAKADGGLSSRLLPNPNPVDPLLAHDRRVKPVSGTRKDAELRAAQLSQAVTMVTAPGATGTAAVAVAHRGPSSSLIHHSPKVLVLDLDETLIHSTSRNPTWSALAEKGRGASISTGGSLLGLEGLGGVLGLRGQVGVRPHQVEVVLDGRSIVYHVYKRPHVDYFLRKVASWYHVVVFTASVQEYADPVIDWLDQGRGLIGTRLFRDSCTYRNGSYQKNLAHVDADLSRVCLVDNSPASYQINQANGIPIEGWTHDPNDEGLLDLLPVLDSLRFASDVRHILGVRGF